MNWLAISFFFAVGSLIVFGFYGVRAIYRETHPKVRHTGTMIKPGQWLPLGRIQGNEKGWRAPPADSTLGWRGWYWNAQEKCLQSPAYQTLWRDSECRVEQWSKDDAVRGVAGIHALWPVPKDWQNSDCSRHVIGNDKYPTVVGIVERYGHYVLGEDGWRAEWVVIRELAACKEVIEDVRKAYPGITVHERTRTEWIASGGSSGGGGSGASGYLITTWIGAGGGGAGGSSISRGTNKLLWPGLKALHDQQMNAMMNVSQQQAMMNMANNIQNTIESNAWGALNPTPDTTGDPFDIV